VFGGYGTTGLPLWPELAQALLDLKHPKVDLLYNSNPPGLVAAYMDGDDLRGRQLDVFGRQSKTYDILGQVVVGFFALNPLEQRAAGSDRVALTLQAVRTRRLDGTDRIDLNVVGRMWDGTGALEAFNGAYQLRILRLITDVRRRLRQVLPGGPGSQSGHDRRGNIEMSSEVAQIMRGMVRSLERVGRQTGRRTVHAEERRESNRPTTKAWDDAFSAPLDHIFWDVYRHTVVVVGPRSRCHVFTPEGRHVTSFLLDGEAVNSRLKRKRWRLLVREYLEQFSAAMGRPDGMSGTSSSGTPVTDAAKE
jgi:hypothetical protein